MLVLASASPRRRELLAQAGYSFTVHPAHIPEDPLPNEDPIACVSRLAREKAEAVYDELVLKGQGTPGLDSETWDSTNLHSTPNHALYQGTTSVVPQKRKKKTGALAPEGTHSESTKALASDQRAAAALQVLGAPGPSHLGTWESTNLNLPSTTSLTVLAADTIVTLDNQILGKPSDPADAARMLRLLSGRIHRVITGVALVTASSTQVAAESTAVSFRALTEQEIAAYIATGEPLDKAGAYAIQGRAARWIPRIEGDYFNVVGLPIALVSTLLKPFEFHAAPPTL